MRIAIFTSHPIQYQAPLFRKIAEQPDVDANVFFFWDYGVKETFDKNFQRSVKWDIPLLDGYKYEFIKNISPKKTSSNFFGEINPGIILKVFFGGYDSAIVLGWQTFSHFITIMACIISGTPVFLRGENPLNQELAKNPIKRAIKQIFLRFLFKFIRGFFYIGEENRKFYEYYGVSKFKLFFVPYAVDNERFMNESKQLKRDGISADGLADVYEKSVTMLFVGKLTDKKRPFDLLKAYEVLSGELSSRRRKTAISLIFVGGGPLEEKLKEYVTEKAIRRVYFAGFKNQTEVSKYYAMSDIFVLPSSYGETWGLVVNEAMCFGLPIVASDTVGCVPDLVKDGENGFIFCAGDIRMLAESLEGLAVDSKKRKKFGAESLKIIKKYSLENDVSAILRAIS